MKRKRIISFCRSWQAVGDDTESHCGSVTKPPTSIFFFFVDVLLRIYVEDFNQNKSRLNSVVLYRVVARLDQSSFIEITSQHSTILAQFVDNTKIELVFIYASLKSLNL